MTDADLLDAPVATTIKVRGEPLAELPQDLYIPPDALEVFLDAFEGPLDLLLYLIRRQNLDPLDIPMAELTRQYLRYIDAARSTRLELAAEYLLMAAVLIDIKSRMLLPRPPRNDDSSEADDPRAELMRRLLEYEQIKLAAQRLAALPQAGRDFDVALAYLPAAARRLPQVDPAALVSAWMAIMARAKNTQHHRIGRQELSIRAHMSRILRHLADGEFAEFREIFPEMASVAELVVSFLAVLELAKEALIEVAQDAPFAPIYVRLREHAGAS